MTHKSNQFVADKTMQLKDLAQDDVINAIAIQASQDMEDRLNYLQTSIIALQPITEVANTAPLDDFIKFAEGKRA